MTAQPSQELSPGFSVILAEVSSHQQCTTALEDTTMRRIATMATEFSTAMVEHGMPTTTAHESHYGQGRAGHRYDKPLEAITEHPVWIVLEDENLDGRSMKRASVGHEKCSYSLGSGTPNNSRTVWEEIDPEDADSYNYSQDDKLGYSESAIAVTGMGELLQLTRQYNGKGRKFSSVKRLPYEVLNDREVTAERLFSAGDLTEEQGQRYVAAMQIKLEEAAKRYAKLRAEESEDTKRGPDYYWGRTEPVLDTSQPRPKYLKTRAIRALRKII